MKLISATPSPWARKVRIVAIEKGIDLEVVNDVPWAPGTCVPQYNPLEKLPILITDEGDTIYESRLIVEWLERRFPTPPMIPADDAGYIMVKKFEVLADGTLDAMLLNVFEAVRPHVDAEWEQRQRRKLAGGMREIARLIGDRDFAVGDRFTLADAAVGSLLGSLDFSHSQSRIVPEGDWRDRYPALAAYFDRHEQRPSFIETRPIMFDFDFTRRGAQTAESSLGA
jgi:glutathione S-transferase